MRARRTISILVALAALAASAFAASSASAAARTYDSQISAGLNRPAALTIDKHDNLWISDPATALVSNYGPYPAQTAIASQGGGGRWGGLVEVRGIALAENDYLWAPTANGDYEGNRTNIFDNLGNFYKFFRVHHFGSSSWMAADLSESDSRGRAYLYAGGEPNGVEAYDGYGNKVDFTGSASYLEENRITGTPSGPFTNQSSGGGLDFTSGMTVDEADGNIFVTDTTAQRVYEYLPSGIFVREFDGTGAPGGFGQFPYVGPVAVDPTNGNVIIAYLGEQLIDEFAPDGEFVGQIAGPPGASFKNIQGLAVDQQGRLYVADEGRGVVDVFKAQPTQPTIAYEADTAPSVTSATLNATVDPNGGGNITSCSFQLGTEAEFALGEYGHATAPCQPDPSGGSFSAPTQVHAEFTGLTTEQTYHYRVVVGNAGASRKGGDRTITTHNVIGLRADPAGPVTATSATLRGSFVGNGADTHYYFEWGKTTAYGNKTAVPPGVDAGSPTGPARTDLSAPISGLEPVTRYHFRIVAANGSTSASDDQSFRTPPLAPTVKASISNVHSNSVELTARIVPGGADTTYFFEYGTSDCSVEPDPCSPVDANVRHIGSNFALDTGSIALGSLSPGTTYHYRLLATNSAATTASPDRTFSTYPFSTELSDSCENALARQQTGSALLSDCRGYELVSAPSAGGYDVESDLVAGEEPFGGFPEADGGAPKVLYGVHSGAIPGVPGNPTNRGVDPYVATRTADGWTTSYVGLDAHNPNASGLFSSTLAEADPKLNAFAFGGPQICTPCFPDGSRGLPLRLPNGSLVQGVAGPEPDPSAEPAGIVRKRFSGDGTHFVFGSTAKLTESAPANGDVKIYDRDLGPGGGTQVVSTDTSGAVLSGPGISELDVSEDGSRVVVGQLVSTDSAGNQYFHLYMHVGNEPKAIDLTPGANAGVIYDGMTADGSQVVFTAKDALAGTGDSDTSADVYRAEVSGATATISRISTGEGDACTPASGWNRVGGGANCDAVAIGGGGGVASNSGDAYFLSPQELDSSGPVQPVANQPNLYVAAPGGSPRFVATLAVGDPVVVDAVQHSGERRTADFQANPSGEGVFATELPITGYDNEGTVQAFRFDPAASRLDCASCSPTNALAKADASLAGNGLSITDDGRVFFNSEDSLVLRDGNNRKDVYEWELQGAGNCGPNNPNLFPTGVCVSLVSSGTSPFDSSLLTVSADGVDAYFFTHDTLSGADLNGPVTKIYDARTEGGLFRVPPPALCAASDECHGPGTEAPPAPNIRTKAGTKGNAKKNKGCPKGKVKKQGKCVKKKSHKKSKKSKVHKTGKRGSR